MISPRRRHTERNQPEYSTAPALSPDLEHLNTNLLDTARAMAKQASQSARIWQLMKRLGIGLLVCTLIAIFLTSQWFINPSLRTHAEAFGQILTHSLLICYTWGLLSIGIVAFTSRFGIDRSHWIRSGLLYLSVGIGFSIVHMGLTSLVVSIIAVLAGNGEKMQSRSLGELAGAVQSNLIIFTVLASVCLALSYYRKFQDRERRALRLEGQLAQAQLQALKSQLQPHFLFNTLNGILVLVKENPELAERMIVQLSKLLRKTLDHGCHDEITLTEELEMTNRYLEIEQMRFGDRLVLRQEVSKEAGVALVPTLITQPIVENAMRHGVAKMSAPCEVVIRAKKEGNYLRVEVMDSGPGSTNGMASREGGVGIANTADRLRQLYGDDFEFTAGNQESTGFAVTIRIPFRRESDANLSEETNP